MNRRHRVPRILREAGSTTAPLSRLAGASLKAGSYRLTLVATNGILKSKPAQTTFKVKKK